MTSTKQSKDFLIQLNFKIVCLVCALLIATLVSISGTKTTEEIMIFITIVLIFGFVSYIDYRKIFQVYDSEVSAEYSDNMLFKSLLYNLPIPILIINEGNVEYHNKEVRILLRRTFRVIATSRFKDLLLEDYADMFEENFNRNKSQGQMIVKLNNGTEYFKNSVCIMDWRSINFNNQNQYVVSFKDITGIYEYNKDIEKEASLYDSILNKLSLSISAFENDGSLCFMNNRFKDDIGTIFSDNFRSVTEFSINKNLLNTAFQIALSGDTFNSEKIIAVKEEGKEIWGNIMISPIQTEKGDNYISYIIDDISKHKIHINNLEEQIKVFSEVYEKTEIAMASWSKDGQIKTSNIEFSKMFNIETNQDVNILKDDIQFFINFDEIIFSKDIALIEGKRYYGSTLKLGKKLFFDSIKKFKKIDAFLKLVSPNDLETENISDLDTESQVLWVKLTAYPLFTTESEMLSFVTNFVDVSDQFNLSKKFETADTYLKAISDNFESGIILIIDTKENIIFIGGNEQVIRNISSRNRKVYSTSKFPLSDVPGLADLYESVKATLNGHHTKIKTIIYNSSYEFLLSPVRNSKGEIDYCLIYGFSVTDRDNYEKELLFQKYLLDKTFTESQIPQVIIDSNGLIYKSNVKYYQLASITPDDLFDLNIYDKNCWLNKPDIITNFEKALKGISSQFEINEYKKFDLLEEDDENYLYKLNCRSYPIFDTNNVVTNVIFNFIDVSDNYMLIENMRKNNAINDVVIENYPSGMLMVFDVNNKVVLFGGGSEAKQLELDEFEIVGNTLDKLKGSVFEVIKPYIHKARTTNESYNFDFDLEFISKNGFPMTLYYDANIIPILDWESNVENIFVCLNNITNRKQLEETILEFNSKLETEVVQRTTQLEETKYDLEVYVAELQDTQNKLLSVQNELKTNLNKEHELNQMKSQFISLMSHEFRTPLTVIQTTVYLLETYFEMGIVDKFEQAGKRILNCIEVMTKLLDNILFLDVAKEQVAVFSKLEIVSVIQGIVNSIKDSTMTTHEIIFKTESEQIILNSDEKLLKQIVHNLLMNAINYSLPTKPINITLLNNEEQFTFIIQDFGNGISDDVIGRIFERFVRSSDFTNISGAGLGLSITKDCVDLLNGEIKFETEKGVGTTFYVTLPKLLQPDADTEGQIEEDDDDILISDTGSVSKIPKKQIEEDDDDILISDTGSVSKIPEKQIDDDDDDILISDMGISNIPEKQIEDDDDDILIG